jgi:hypothetical protein
MSTSISRSQSIIEDIILDSTEYTNKSNNPYTFTASMMGNDVLQNYLTVLYGSEKDTTINEATLGSVFHLGMERAIEAFRKDKHENKGYEDIARMFAEKNMQTKLNDWTISGTADLIIEYKNHEVEIHDFKLTKMYAINKMKTTEELYNHRYNLQLNILSWLHNRNNINGGQSYSLYIDAFAKDNKAIKQENVFHQIRGKLRPFVFLVNEITKKTDILQKYIESNEIPPVCEELWPRRLPNGTTINTKCSFYCSHGKTGKCPYYNPGTRELKAVISGW